MRKSPAFPPADWVQRNHRHRPADRAAPWRKRSAAVTGEEALAFFDAIAPIVHKDTSISAKPGFSRATTRPARAATAPTTSTARSTSRSTSASSRPCSAGEKTAFKEWEASTPYFEGCLPIEVMAERGRDTLRFGPMKPVGLTDPRTGRRPYAVVQLRQDNALGTLYNMVGFQTKLKHGEQARIFRMIPGLEKAEFARLGGLHRNTFINSPRLLDGQLRLKAEPRLRFAGQITGVEGYVESAAIGLLAGSLRRGRAHRPACLAPPRTTALGALLGHITGGADARSFQPMNINFGLFPPIPETERKQGRGDRKRRITARALADLDAWLGARQAAE